jgi:hypothetical protein
MRPSSDGPGLRSDPLISDVELASLGPMVSVRTSVAEPTFRLADQPPHTPAAKVAVAPETVELPLAQQRDRERLACNGYAYR